MNTHGKYHDVVLFGDAERAQNGAKGNDGANADQNIGAQIDVGRGECDVRFFDTMD